MEKGLKIVIPTRPQPDTLVAIFLLQYLAKDKFPGVETAKVEVQPLIAGTTFEDALNNGMLLLDVGGGPLDHHGNDTCASELVARMLGLENDPTLTRMLAYAKRDDREGRGTVSVDPLDRAFGLSGLIAALNKQHPNAPQKVVDAVMPLLEAHYRGAHEHHVELPRDVEAKKARGEYEEGMIKHAGKKIKYISVISDKPSMPTYLRSWNGGRADVVLQKSEDKNRVCVITRQDRNVNLAFTAGMIRLREAELRDMPLNQPEEYLMQNGKIAELPFWYFDPATNSILNVGNEPTDYTVIPWEEMKTIVKKGLELAS